MSQHLQASTPDYDPTRDLDPAIHPFELDQRLANDCIVMGRFGLSELLLMNDANYPWFILVPEREDIFEIFQLDEVDQRQLLDESTCLAAHIHKVFHADKLNIAALGNVVPQLHIHHIVRYRDDASWPRPVWGEQPAVPYSVGQADAIRSIMQGICR